MSFASLKANRAKSIEKLVNAAGSLEKKSYGDDRLWQPTVDKAGNGYAVIRFLPTVESEDLPWVRFWDHGFKGPSGRWYIENSLTTIGQPDPVSELNSKLWNSGREEDKETARKQKRRLHHISNILVISDPENPENEGKTFLYKYGKKIFDKIMDVMQPQFQDETPVNPFDLWGGADFKLKIRQVDGYRNYDKSEFGSPSELFGGDEKKLEALYNKLVPLAEFTDPANFKTYGELKRKLQEVLGEETIADTYTPKQKESLTQVQEAKVSGPAPVDTPMEDTDPNVGGTGDSEDTLGYFAKLAMQGD